MIYLDNAATTKPSDKAKNAFLEAWSLLTNEYNGLLTHPEIATNLPFKNPVSSDVYKKITAVIVYTSSIDQLMFCDFRHVWQRTNCGCKFRMFVLDEKLRENELNNNSNLLFQITGMNPDQPEPLITLFSGSSKSPQDSIFANKMIKTIQNNVLT